MLVQCSECHREISDQADSCPNCGHPIKVPAPRAVEKNPSPIFLVLALIFLVMGFYTPRLLVFFPIVGTLGCAAVALLRHEPARWLAILALLGGIGLFSLSQADLSGLQSDAGDSGTSSTFGSMPDLSAVEITDWNWEKERYRTSDDGVVKWNVQVHNKSSRNIHRAKLEFTTFDSDGKLISTDEMYVWKILPGQKRASRGRADYYGTESSATVQIVDVKFAE